MREFLDDATDFTGIAVKDNPGERFESMRKQEWVHCPLCHGHGNWNLTLNAYGPGQHFQAFCRQCWGWGWVEKDSPSVTCIHKFVEIAPDQPFRCWHTIRCTECGEKRSYSSDD